jgi:hypothetical protein
MQAGSFTYLKEYSYKKVCESTGIPLNLRSGSNKGTPTLFLIFKIARSIATNF